MYPPQLKLTLFCSRKVCLIATFNHSAILFSPKEPPPPEKPWNEVESDVQHYDDASFKGTVRKKKHALIMFYAPCKFLKLTPTKLIVSFQTTLCTLYQGSQTRGSHVAREGVFCGLRCFFGNFSNNRLLGHLVFHRCLKVVS